MDVAYISALSALGGSVIGGLASGITTWMNARVQARTSRAAHDILRREELYKDFIVLASKVYADAFMHDEPQVPDMVAIYGLMSRMRVLCSARIVAAAEAVMGGAVEMYFGPNRTVRELHEMIKAGELDPLREFSEIARKELWREAD